MNHILQRLSSPWAIEPQWLRVAWGVGTRGRIDAAALAQAKAEWDARRAAGPKMEEPGAPVEGTGGTLRIVGNVGVLSIEGPLFRHADMFTDISGGTSYNALWRGLEAALASPQVAAILLRINSPGGEADGLNELAEAIAAAGDNKPIWTYADGMCASAAYWMASQTARIVAEPTTELGSIGVRCGILDDSKADEMAGVRSIEIVSSVSPGKRGTPVSDEVIARVQTRIDDLAEIFIDAVARGRGVSTDAVLSDFGQGNVMIASKAVAAGLADDVGNFNSTLAALSGAAITGSAAPSARATRGAKMSITSTPAAAAVTPRAGDEPPAMRCAGCDADMTGKKGYCATCYDGDEPDGDEGDDEAKALASAGLLGGKKLETRARLAAFAASVLSALGVTTSSAALARVVSNASDAEAFKIFRADAEAAATRSRTSSIADKLLAALSDNKITLGMAAKEIPLLLGASKAAARAALEAIPENGWTGPGVVAALTGIALSAEQAESIEEWIAAKGASALPPARRQPDENDDDAAAMVAPPSTKPKSYTVDAAASNANKATKEIHR